VSATGVCTAKVSRDKLGITLAITALDKNAAVSLRAAQDAANTIISSIKKIDDKALEIQTARISSYEKTKWEKNTSVLIGIESAIDIDITTDNSETINSVLSVSTGDKKVQILPRNMRNFSSRTVMDAAIAKCLEIAITDARGKAYAIATADGEKIGRLLSANFIGGGNNFADYDAVNILFERAPIAAGKAMGKVMSSDYIQSSEGELSITIDATFRIR
jgi:uncharacterized protein YggE